MRALVVVAGTFLDAQALMSRRQGPLVPCIDRPVLQHVVEILVDRGYTQFDFLLHEMPREIEEFMGDGSRWGSNFTFHLAHHAESCGETLRLVLNDHEPVLLIHADCTPLWQDHEVSAKRPEQNTLFYTSALDGASEWTGCALLLPDAADAIPSKGTRIQLEQSLRRLVGDDGVEHVDFLDFRSCEGLLATQGRLLSKSSSISHLSARETEPGVWIARNVVIHPTAQLTPPLFIGENSRIGAEAVIGPNAVIGRDSIIDQHTLVTESAVLPGSYCGEHLELDHVIVDRNRLINGRLGTAVNVSDTFIISGLRAKNRTHSLRRLFSRAIASLLLILTSPLVALMGLFFLSFRGQAFIHSKRVVQLPVLDTEVDWTTFNLYTFRNPDSTQTTTRLNSIFLDFLPALWPMATGNLHFVGVRPRTEGEIKSMPADWQALYLQSFAGLITESFVVHGPAASEDEVYSSDAYYSAVSGFGHDLSLAVRFITGVA